MKTEKERMARRVYRRRHKVRRRFGIRLEEYGAAMSLFWGGCCSACGQDFGPHGPCLDCDRATGEIFGALCIRCRTLAGTIRYSPEAAARLASYLNDTRNKHGGAPAAGRSEAFRPRGRRGRGPTDLESNTGGVTP